MKSQKSSKKKKKPNIPLRRKAAIIYSRITLVFKITFAFCCYLFFFTTYFASLKFDITQNIYELTSDIGFTLENVLIEGQHNVTESDILATLNADKGTPIFSLNLALIKENLERNNWIKNVYIERRLPHTIYINLRERTPIAIWQINGQLFLIDQEGYKITESISQFQYLLHLVGPDANIYASKLINDLAKYPELANKLASSVRYGERRWNLNFDQNITVKMPEINFEEALEYLANLNNENKLFDQGVKIIDMRDRSKYYIEKD